jgi:spore maturation protein CgeB
VHLDISRAYQRDIVTLRVFDILACGGFVLAEHSEELSRVFAPDEIETWRTLGELRAKVAHFVAHPDERRERAARGRARVLRDHRLSQRVERILALAAPPAS